MPNAHVRHSRYITLAGCKGTLNTYTRQYIPCQNIHGGPILGKFGRAGSCEGSIAVQRGTDSVRAGYRLGRLRAGSTAVYLVLKKVPDGIQVRFIYVNLPFIPLC